MARSESKKNATHSEVRRMYIRGLKRTLKVNVLSFEEALALARVSPKIRPAKKKEYRSPHSNPSTCAERPIARAGFLVLPAVS
jgi:hypothetical protein